MKNTLKLWLTVFAVTLVLTMLIEGCAYTHPSVAQPDLVEKLSTGHVICYYKVGPSRGYAKCCEDCPMHSQTITGETR